MLDSITCHERRTGRYMMARELGGKFLWTLATYGLWRLEDTAGSSFEYGFTDA